MKHHAIIRIAAKFLIPPILLFALYVQFHGDFGPGGGFQAGVLFAVGFILYALMSGLTAAEHALPVSAVRICLASGVLIYAGVGVACMLLGGRFLEYDVLARDGHAGQHLGILLVELGVGVTVFGVMVAVFYAFAGRRRETDR